MANKLDNLDEIDKFLKTHKSYKLTQKSKENFIIPVTSENTELIIKTFPVKKSPGPDDFIGELYKD